jgi:hypothetical protein
LSAFGHWLEKTHRIPDPFAGKLVRRETCRPPCSKDGRRGNWGGAKPLPKETAVQTAESVTCAAATGVREKEHLAFHTSRIDLRNGRVVIERQLNRYKP